jgi:hypothetical protein
MRGIGGSRGLDKILGWSGIMLIRAGSFAALRLAQDGVRSIGCGYRRTLASSLLRLSIRWVVGLF